MLSPPPRLQQPLPTNTQYSVSDKPTECPKARQERTCSFANRNQSRGWNPEPRVPIQALQLHQEVCSSTWHRAAHLEGGLRDEMVGC